MLHKINLPRSWIHLSWIVAFQHRLLKNLCLPNIKPQDVSVEWVQQLFPKLDRRWILSFCNRQHEKEQAIVRMQAIAALDDATKIQLLTNFENDILLQQAFLNDCAVHFELRSLTCLQDEKTHEQVRRLFESFYDPYFYRNENNSRQGYYIPQHNQGSYHFHYHEFLDKFNAANEKLLVCPFCDGPLSGVQIDHFYARQHYPFLSCHPLNLVPICSDCNKGKLASIPMSKGNKSQNPFINWFHPYLLSLSGSFVIEFIWDDQNRKRPVLRGQDAQTEVRLQNLRTLLKLDERYAKEYKRRVDDTKERILGWLNNYRRRRHSANLAAEDLNDKLALWADETPIGKEQFGFIAKAYFERAAAGDTDMYPVLWESFIQGISMLGLQSDFDQASLNA